MRILALLALLALPPAGVAQPDPGAAYKAYHEAALQGRIEIARNFTSSNLTKQLMYRTPQERAALSEKMRVLMPNTYGILKRAYAPDGRSVTLTLSGKVVTPYRQDVLADVKLVKFAEVWKVDAVSWRSTTPPPSAAPLKPAAKPAPKPLISKEAPKPATARPNVPPPTHRTLGRQKEPCVFKPAMTAEDLERCK